MYKCDLSTFYVRVISGFTLNTEIFNSHTSSSILLQVFRTDLITAMKLHDSYQLNPEDYYELADPWRQEWEKGVQVPVSPDSIPQPKVRYEDISFSIFGF